MNRDPYTRGRREPRRRQAGPWRTVAGALCGILLFATSAADTEGAATPEEVLKRYLAAVYARDYPPAYELISRQDRKFKTKEEYAREQGTFTGPVLEVTRALASYIRYGHVRTVIEGDHATVTFRASYPDANAPAVEGLLLEFDERRIAALSPAERKAILEKLEEMARSGRLPVIVSANERWELVRENGTWRVFLNWAGAVVVRFKGAVRAGLPWAFEPVQPVVRAQPGETLQTAYRVRNLSNREVAAKARHILDPPEKTGYLQVVNCFCFIQQTLKPREARELPVVFRVNGNVPKSLRAITVHYEFYPIDRFPAGKGR